MSRQKRRRLSSKARAKNIRRSRKKNIEGKEAHKARQHLYHPDYSACSLYRLYPALHITAMPGTTRDY